MKKIRTVFIVIAVYELLKIIFTLLSRPLIKIVALPFSWYAAAPLLILPFLALILLAADPIKYCEYCFLIILSKIIFLLSVLYYIVDTLSVYIQNFEEIKASASFQFLIFLLIFFLFDVILSIVISLTERKIKSINLDSEGSVCK
ncbi:MAG: hypothetical protein KA785_03180 [Spirochaetaceae bacterium]|jgi:hypothetical protein|nr:hypothetical protein [Spirochaetaceae bacterium]